MKKQESRTRDAIQAIDLHIKALIQHPNTRVTEEHDAKCRATREEEQEAGR